MENSKDFLGTQPVGKLLFKLAIPTVIAQLINMLYNIVDRIFIGHISDAGSLALTGVGVTMPIIMIVSAFAGLVSSGGAPRASISMGKGDMDSAEQTLGGCFLLQVIVSIVLTVVLLLFGENLLLAFGASENTISYAASYLNIYAFGTLFVQLTLGMNAFVTAEGFTKISMVSVAIGAILNIVLDPIMIFGLNMGVRGAALATVISQAVSCIVVVTFLCSKKSILRLKRKNLNIKPKVVFPCIALGTAAFIMQASESVISVCFNSSLLKYGGDIAVGYYINIDFARSRMEFKSGVRMTERGGQMFPYEVELERPLSSKTGECFHVDVIVSGTILEVYVDNRIALGTRMFDIKGGNFGLYASDAEANFMNIQIFKKKI